MSLSAALHAVVASFRRRPADVLPFYAFGAAVPAVARIALFVAIVLGYVHLLTTGRLGPVVDDLASRDLNPPDPQNPEAFSQWMEGLEPVLEPIATPTVAGLLLAGLGLTLVFAVLLGAVASAARFATVAAVLRGERGLPAGVAGVRRHWLSYLGLYVLELVLWIVVTVVAVAPVVVGFAVSPVLGALVAIVAFSGWLLAVVAIRAVFAFAQPAVAVDRTGVFGAIRTAGGFVRAEPVAAAAYYAISIGTLLGVGVVAGATSLLGIGNLSGPVVLLAVTPALEVLKTGLLADYRGSFSPPTSPDVPLRSQVAGGLRRGLREFGAFVRATPGLTALSTAIGLGGFALGWVAAAPFVGSLDTSIVERLADHVPPAAAVDFFANNWTVAIATALSGLAAAVPAAVSVWVNGFVFGLYARLEADPEVLVAFVTPHGIFEIPALIVSGSLGLFLGLAWWRTWRGTADRAALADALERAFWVLVGIGVLLAIAGLIEGFVSPYYWRPFL